MHRLFALSLLVAALLASGWPVHAQNRRRSSAASSSRATSGSSPARSKAIWPCGPASPTIARRSTNSIKSLYAHRPVRRRDDRAAGRRRWWCRSSRTRSSIASRSRATSGSRPRSWRRRSSCARAWSTPALECRTPSTASSSSIGATGAMPRRSSPRSSSSTRTASISCSRSARARRPASAASRSSATKQFSDSTLRGVIQTREAPGTGS